MNETLLTVRPWDLAGAIMEIITQEARCEASWEQHSEPLNSFELREIALRILDLVGQLGVPLDLRVPAAER